MRREKIVVGNARLEVSVHGDPGAGPAVLLIPSLGRSVRDFDALAEALSAAGFALLAAEPRGIGTSSGPLAGLTLHDLAADAAGVIRATAPGPVDVIGHAFGNRVARCLASDHPELVRRVCLLGAGGLVPAIPAARDAFRRYFNEDLDETERRAAMRAANFSPRSDPQPWLSGWWPDTGRGQAAAAAATPVEAWWEAGAASVLIVQGLDDRMAPPANGRALKETLGTRARLVEIAGAGHALLPEQPAEVSRAVVDFLTASG